MYINKFNEEYRVSSHGKMTTQCGSNNAYNITTQIKNEWKNVSFTYEINMSRHQIRKQKY